MESSLSKNILANYKGAHVVAGTGEKYFIKGIGFEGIDVEIMPNNSNDFTLRFCELEFFAKDDLENYLRQKLKYEDVEFKVNTWRIYAYVRGRRESSFAYEAFKYTLKETLDILASIRSILK